MSFELSAEEQLIVEAVHELAAGPNGRAHWRESALANTFPDRLWQALAEAGYLGLLVPPEHGGAGLGLTEMAVLMEAMAAEGMALLLMSQARQPGAEAPLPPGARARHDPLLLRDHRAERGLEQLPPRDARHSRRRRLPHPRAEVLHLGGRASAARAARDA